MWFSGQHYINFLARHNDFYKDHTGSWYNTSMSEQMIQKSHYRCVDKYFAHQYVYKLWFKDDYGFQLYDMLKPYSVQTGKNSVGFRMTLLKPHIDEFELEDIFVQG